VLAGCKGNWSLQKGKTFFPIIFFAITHSRGIKLAVHYISDPVHYQVFPLGLRWKFFNAL
jgi:hypothetical protein